MTNTRRMKKAVIAAAAAIAAADFSTAAAAVHDFAAALDKPVYYTGYGLVTADMLPDAPFINGLDKAPADIIAAAAAAVCEYIRTNPDFLDDGDYNAAAAAARDFADFANGYGIPANFTAAAAKTAAAAAAWIAECKEG